MRLPSLALCTQGSDARAVDSELPCIAGLQMDLAGNGSGARRGCGYQTNSMNVLLRTKVSTVVATLHEAPMRAIPSGD